MSERRVNKYFENTEVQIVTVVSVGNRTQYLVNDTRDGKHYTALDWAEAKYLRGKLLGIYA